MNLSPDQWNLVGANCSEKGQFTTAIHCFRRALALDERRHDIRANLADNLRRNWQFDEALVEIHAACRHGMFDKAQFILGCLYHDMGLPEKALKHFTARLCVTPYAQDCRGQSFLCAGQYAEGFAAREARLEMFKWGSPPLPMWMGEPLEGKTVLIHHEQGYGDSFAYARWLNQMPEGSYMLGMPGPMVDIMTDSFGCPTFNTNAPLPAADYYLPLMSLPHRLGITEISPLGPYICPLGRFDIPRAPDTRLKVGIVWRSKAGHDDANPSVSIHGQQKSIPLELLLPLGDIPGVTLYSLQTDSGDIKKLGADYLIYDLGSKITTFHDLALFMKEMDVIVSVDTAPLHLAGAMGLETIGLLSCRGGWPYPGMDNATPWYDTMTLIRQETPHDWKGVVDRLALSLTEMLDFEPENAIAAQSA